MTNEIIGAALQHGPSSTIRWSTDDFGATLHVCCQWPMVSSTCASTAREPSPVAYHYIEQAKRQR